MKIIEINLPIKSESEGNTVKIKVGTKWKTEHWRSAHKRHKVQQAYVRVAFSRIPVQELPITIEMIRQAPRALDDDNLRFSMKWIRDQIADCLIPGKAKGQADSDPRITWLYNQRKGKPKEYNVILRLIPSNDKILP